MRPNTVAVVGLGYVGLPLALLAREKKWQVIGIDVDREKISKINKGRLPFTNSELQEKLKQYPIKATADPAQIALASIIVIAVPTPVTNSKQPNLNPLISAVKSIKPHLRPKQTIIVESTINPGVMDEIIAPILADISNVHLVHCPERINPGDTKWSVRNIPRVLGGYTSKGTNQALKFYRSVLDAPIKIMGSPTEAEAVKILENTFRDINIAYINEMARSFNKLGINITNVIEGAATKPFAFLPHYPSCGVGGHCISVDPYYMIERARQVGFDHKFLKLARKINDRMPAYTVSLLQKGLKKKGLVINSTRVAILGVAYKKNTSDTRNSPALKIIKLLKEKKAALKIYDPYVPKRSNVTSLSAALNQATAVILACDHDELTSRLTPSLLNKNKIVILVDGKNALPINSFHNQNIDYYGIGRSAHN